MLVNLTPHALTIISDSEAVTLPPSGSVARCAVISESAGEFVSIDLTRENWVVDLARTKMGEVVGLPDPSPGVLYVVSMVVRAACPERSDVASPGELVRDAKGNPIGCRGLVVN